jgi:hypothetical protein
LNDSIRQIELAGNVARELRMYLTYCKTKQQRQSAPIAVETCVAPLYDDACGIEDPALNQKTLPEMIQACRCSRLQLVALAPRLLEESVHTSNSDVRNL